MLHNVNLSLLLSISSLVIPAYTAGTVSTPVGQLDVKNATSIRAYAKHYAESIINEYYSNNPSGSSIGIFYSKPAALGGEEITWSTSATLWNALIAYSNLTSDTQFNDVVASALYAQVGDDAAYMPANQTKTLGNANQTLWGLTALSAAELGFPKERDGQPGWLDLAQNVFDLLTLRWNDTTCRGGLRDAIFTFDGSYNQMSSFTASNFFLLSSRLYKMTNNETYSQWAEKQYTAATDNRLLGDKGAIVDYLEIEDDGCTLQKSEGATSENLGHWLEGAAVMFNATNRNQTWSTRLSSLKIGIDAFTSFSGNNIDTDCTASNTTSSSCGIASTLQFARSLSRSIVYASSLLDSDLTSLLQLSATAANTACGVAKSAGEDGQEFDFKAWCSSRWDGQSAANDGAAGQVVNVGATLESVQGLLWTMDRAGQDQEQASGTTTGGSGSASETAAPGSAAAKGGVSWRVGVGAGVVVVAAFIV